MSEFEKTLLELNYAFLEQDGKKLTYKKERAYSDLVLVIDLGLKYINPILVPKSVILYESDLAAMVNDFNLMQKDAYYLSQKSHFKLQVLNNNKGGH